MSSKPLTPPLAVPQWEAGVIRMSNFWRGLILVGLAAIIVPVSLLAGVYLSNPLSEEPPPLFIAFVILAGAGAVMGVTGALVFWVILPLIGFIRRGSGGGS